MKRNNKSIKGISNQASNQNTKKPGLLLVENGIVIDTTDEAFSGGVIIDLTKA